VPERDDDVVKVPGSNFTMIAQVAPAAICDVHPFFSMVKSVDPVTDADATCNIAGLAAEFVTVIV